MGTNDATPYRETTRGEMEAELARLREKSERLEAKRDRLVSENHHGEAAELDAKISKVVRKIRDLESQLRAPTVQ